MLSKSRSILLATALLTAPMTVAMAQQNNPTGNMGSNRSITGTAGTADSKAASGTNTADVGVNNAPTGNYAGMSGTKPGSTGKTVVPGTNSSQTSAANATREQQSGASPAGGGK